MEAKNLTLEAHNRYLRPARLDIPFSMENGYARTVKGVLDAVFSILILTVFLAPLIFLFTLLLIDSCGSPFFVQERVGFLGRIFRIYKFRTMKKGSELELHKYLHLNQRKGPVFKLKNDPRVTFIGRVLRRLSLDEFPQFINVLEGKMSIIGPRPPVLWEASRYDRVAMMRLGIKPGITGLWQVSGRAEMDFDDMVDVDIVYILNCSFAHDLQILAKTFPVMFSTKGAY